MQMAKAVSQREPSPKDKQKVQKKLRHSVLRTHTQTKPNKHLNMDTITERQSDEGTSKRSSDEINAKQDRLKSIAKSIMSKRDRNSNDTNGAASLESF